MASTTPQPAIEQIDMTASGDIAHPQIAPLHIRFMLYEWNYGPISAGGTILSGQGPNGSEGAIG